MNHLKLSTSQNVLTICLNRPEKRNAFFPEMIAELTKAFHEAGRDKKLRAAVLTGAGSSFCSGGDLEWMRSMAHFTLKQNTKDAEALFAMFWTIYQCPIPVLGRVFGHCFGGGAGLVAVCDVVAAEAKTQFSFSEVKWGLVPAVISPFVFERAAPSRVAEWFMSAKVFQAPEAQSGGLVNFVGDLNEVDTYLDQTLSSIIGSAPQAVRETKRLLRSYSKVSWKTVRARVIKTIATARVGEEGQRGLSAFLNKETPRWSDPGYGAPTKI